MYGLVDESVDFESLSQEQAEVAHNTDARDRAPAQDKLDSPLTSEVGGYGSGEQGDLPF